MKSRCAEATVRPVRWRTAGALAGLLAASFGMLASLVWGVSPAEAQQQEIRLKPALPSLPDAGPGAGPAQKGGGSPGWGAATVRPPAPVPGPSDGSKGRISLSAHLTQDGEPINAGLVWRVYSIPPPATDAAQSVAPVLVNTLQDAAPTAQLAPGSYAINVAYGRAHLTRRITVANTQPREERFVLNAGGLRVTCHLLGGEKLTDTSASYSIFEGDADQISGRARVATGLKPGVIVRLNAGLYHIVSSVGDANAQVSADVTVEAGKLTDAVLSHAAARVKMKLVAQAGGEALADTVWAVHTDQGELVRESQGALPAHILAAGTYIASARHGGRLYQRQFTVVPGQSVQVEVIVQ